MKSLSPAALRSKGIERRLVVVVLVALGEDAHADLVERRGAQRFERLLLQFLATDASTRSRWCQRERTACRPRRRSGACCATRTGPCAPASAAMQVNCPVLPESSGALLVVV